MNLTEDQKTLVEFARDFAKKELAPVVAECDEKSEFPKEVFKKYFEAGFATMWVPQEFGGEGISTLDMVLVNEEFAKVDCGFIISATTAEFGSMPIRLYGTPELQKYYMDRVMQGQLGSFCLTEPDAGSDAAATRTTATRDGDDYIINGRKCFITSGGLADMFTVFATVDRSLGHKGITCFLVERERVGVSNGKEENKMGIRCSNTCDVIFDNVRIPASNRVGEEGQGFAIAMNCLNRSRGVNSFASVALCERAIQEVIDYGMQRCTFGKPILYNQGMQFMLADMQIQTLAAQTMLYECARQADNGIFDAQFGSAVKTFCSDVAMKVTTDAVQMMGGYGYSKEYPVEKLMRDAKIMQIFEGTNQIQRMTIANTMLPRRKK